jgi:hypothetical protein
MLYRGIFRCPHCRERTIGVLAKLKANGLQPSACPSCEGKYVPAVWTTLPILALVLGALFAPLLLAGHVPFPLLSSWLVPGLLAAAGLYLAAPLLRYGSTASRWEWWTLAATVIAVALYTLFAVTSDAAAAASCAAWSSSPTTPGSSSTPACRSGPSGTPGR